MPEFQYEAGTYVYDSCSTSLNGRMLIFGGADGLTNENERYGPDSRRQILEVGACGPGIGAGPGFVRVLRPGLETRVPGRKF